jgi:hypothetical protein
MFGFGKKPPEVSAAGALLDLVQEQWSDIEAAKSVATTVMFLADLEFVPKVLKRWPEFMDKPAQQRMIGFAMYVANSKSGASALGKAECTTLLKAAANYASRHGEWPFFEDMRAAIVTGQPES